MKKGSTSPDRRLGLTLALLLLVPATAGYAVDGVIEINQARALAGGVTPSDGPGFPVTLDTAGSYRLTGNLTVPDENTNAISVGAGANKGDVTIDLNGFSIIGPTECSGSPVTTCTPTGTGIGISGGSLFYVSVHDGFVRGMGNMGIEARNPAIIQNVQGSHNGGTAIDVGGSSVVRGNRVSTNGGAGIQAGTNSVVTGNTASGNRLEGLVVSGVCSVTGNAVYTNGGTGIDAGNQSLVGQNNLFGNKGDGIICGIQACTVIGNNVVGSTGWGLNLGAQAGYANNVLFANSGGDVTGGTQMGTNICGGSPCP